MKTCKCIKASSWTTIGAGKGVGPVTFQPENTYELTIIPNEVFGDCYSVKDNVSGFVANYSKTKFEEYFQEL